MKWASKQYNEKYTYKCAWGANRRLHIMVNVMLYLRVRRRVRNIAVWLSATLHVSHPLHDMWRGAPSTTVSVMLYMQPKKYEIEK